MVCTSHVLLLLDLLDARQRGLRILGRIIRYLLLMGLLSARASRINLVSQFCRYVLPGRGQMLLLLVRYGVFQIGRAFGLLALAVYVLRAIYTADGG